MNIEKCMEADYDQIKNSEWLEIIKVENGFVVTYRIFTEKWVIERRCFKTFRELNKFIKYCLVIK